MAWTHQHAYHRSMHPRADTNNDTDTPATAGTATGSRPAGAAGPAGTSGPADAAAAAGTDGPARRRGRIAGAAAAGLGSLALGLAAHAVSGGALPSPPILAGLASLAVLAATLVALGRFPGWALLILLGAGQQILHWLLGGLADAPSSTVPGAGGHHAGDVPLGAGGAGGHSPEVMLLLHTHLAAALLVGWVTLRHRAVTSWLRAWARRAPRGPHGTGAPAVGGNASS